MTRMKSTRCSIQLEINVREEVEKGVFENSINYKTVKAEQEKIFQQRADQAKLQGLPINARFRIRGNYKTDDLDYVSFKGDRYKVLSVTPQLENHYTIIEIGQMM